METARTSTPSPSILAKCGRPFLLLVCSSPILIFISSCYSEFQADKRANDFCSATAIGEEENKLSHRIFRSRADRSQRRRDLDGSHWTILFEGFTPIDRHMCLVTVKDDKVVAKETRYLD